MKILIAEDDPTAQKVMQGMMEKYGDCTICENGRIAFDVFKAAHEAGAPFDLLCLDVMMPEMDGNELLEQVRALETEKSILGLDGVKVVMTTAVDSPKSVMGSFKKGCEAYIVKPVSREKIEKELQKLGVIEGP